jgi:elongation factor P hydroxylase
MILYIKDLKNSTPKLIDTIKSFCKVAGYKINLQKSVAFLYTNNEQAEKEYKKTIYNSVRKYVEITLMKDVNDLYKEN